MKDDCTCVHSHVRSVYGYEKSNYPSSIIKRYQIVNYCGTLCKNCPQNKKKSVTLSLDRFMGLSIYLFGFQLQRYENSMVRKNNLTLVNPTY